MFSNHWHNEAFILRLSTGEGEVVLGGLQQLYIRKLFKSIFYFMKTGFSVDQKRRFLPYAAGAENFACSF